MSTSCVIALDVGGTRIKAGLVDTRHRVLLDRTWETGASEGPEAVAERVLSVVADLTGLARESGFVPTAVGVALPGLVDEAAGRVILSANLGWRDVALGERVIDRTGLPTAIGHDVRAGGLAESVLGAGRGCRDLLFLPIGTGIAGAMIVNGELCTGGGYAGEIGHLSMDPDGPACPCGGRGCLELYASAAAIARTYSARTGTKTTAAQVAERTAAGDPIARQVWQQAVQALAGALSAYVTICAPELVVVGGGLAESGETLLGELRVALADRLSFQRAPRLVRARFGDRAGRLGAALLAQRAAVPS